MPHHLAKSIIQLNKKNRIICIYDSISTASNMTGEPYVDISKIANNKIEPSKFNWIFFDEYINKNQIRKKSKQYKKPKEYKTHHLAKPVYQLNKSGIIIRIWDSITIASTTLNIDYFLISKIANKKEPPNKYNWIFVKDSGLIKHFKYQTNNDIEDCANILLKMKN